MARNRTLCFCASPGLDALAFAVFVTAYRPELFLAAAVMAKQREAHELLTYRRNYVPRFVLLP
jgi:hypothetical protein